MDFWRAYRVLARRKWIIVAVVLVTTLVTVAGVQLFGLKYDASTVLQPTDQAIQQAVNAVNANGQAVVVTDDSRMNVVNEIAAEVGYDSNIGQAIYSLANADQLVANLGQYGNIARVTSASASPTYTEVTSIVKGGMQQMSASEIKDVETKTGIASGLWPDFVYLYAKMKALNIPMDVLQPGQLPRTVADVAKNTEVKSASSRSVLVTVRNANPRLAEIYADAITANYKYYYDERNHSAALKSLEFYNQQAMDARKRFALSQRRLAAFRQSHREIFLPDYVSSAVRRNDSARNEIDSINTNLRDLDAQIAAKKARLVSLPRMLTRQSKTENPEIAVLRERINGLSADLAAKSGVWTDKNPEIVRLKDQIASLQARLDKVQGTMQTNKVVTENDEWLSTDRDIARLSQQRNGLAARVGVLNGVIAQQARLISTLPETSAMAQALQDDYKGNSDRVTDLNKKYETARDALQQADAGGAIGVAFWAGTGPSTPDHQESQAQEGATKTKVSIIVAAFLLSILISTGVVLGLDFMDTSLKTTVDVERMLDVPVNGIVPRLDGASRGMLPQVTHKLPGSPHAESYRFLGTDILLSAAGPEPFKTIMVATAKPGQGGTSTVCNLAITLAQAGQTVALVDADLRRPSLHRVFSLDNTMGLTTVLNNGKLPSDVLQRTEIDNLYVMTGGPTADNAWKLLRSAKMRDVITDLSRDFDFVLFDTPSAVVFADAATLATMVDGVLMVVRAHESPCGSELQVKNLLNKTKARIVGVVLNDMPVQQVDSARFFNHYYGPGAARQELPTGSTKPALPRGASDDEI